VGPFSRAWRFFEWNLRPSSFTPALGHDPIRRTLARLDADVLAGVVGAWLADRDPARSQHRDRGQQRPGVAAGRRAVAVDGKTLRLRHEVARDEWLRWRRFDVMSKT
jgi:hypothetical protein